MSELPRPSRRLVLGALLDALLPRGVGNLVVALWVLGAAIAGLSTWLALLKLGALAGLPYAVVTVGLVVLAGATRRRLPWALAASLFLLGLQLLGVVGSAIELRLGEAASKTSTLRSLDVDPTLGILANLAYSAAASGLFGWTLIAFVVRRRRSRPIGTERRGSASSRHAGFIRTCSHVGSCVSAAMKRIVRAEGLRRGT
jgi:hypothetical protein